MGASDTDERDSMSPEDAAKINQLLDMIEAEGAQITVHDGKIELTLLKGDQPTPAAKQLATNLRLRFDIADIQLIVMQRARRRHVQVTRVAD